MSTRLAGPTLAAELTEASFSGCFSLCLEVAKGSRTMNSVP
jgi:hypothetical protein